MRYTKWFASFALAAGLAVAGTTAASAQEWRDSRPDYNRAEVARDRARPVEDYRCNRVSAVRDRVAVNRLRYEARDRYRDDHRDRDGFRR